MDFRLKAVLCIATLALCAGCRQNHAHRELLERELRFQEDRIYQLEAELETTRRELSRYCEGPPPGFTPPGFSAHDGSTTFSDAVVTPDARSAPSTGTLAPSVDLPVPTTTKKEAAPPFVAPPVIMPPDVNVPEGLPSRSVTPGASSPQAEPVPPAALPTMEPKLPQFKTMSSPKFLSPSLRPGAAMSGAPSNGAAVESLPPEPVPQGLPSQTKPTPPATPSPTIKPMPNIAAVPLPSDERVTSLTFGKRTGGMNLDGRPGDEGILIVLEPRSARGDVISAAGDVSVVLIDPAVPGEGGRYARWDFTGTDATALFRAASTEGPAGIYLELSWPDAAPQHARLKLFVRLRTSDGRQLQIDRDVSVELPVGAATNAAPEPFTPTLAPPRVTPVVAPTPDEHDLNAPAPLNWSKHSAVRQAAVPQSPVVPASPPNGSVYESAPLEGPSLGPALIPAVPR